MLHCQLISMKIGISWRYTVGYRKPQSKLSIRYLNLTWRNLCFTGMYCLPEDIIKLLAVGWIFVNEDLTHFTQCSELGPQRISIGYKVFGDPWWHPCDPLVSLGPPVESYMPTPVFTHTRFNTRNGKKRRAHRDSEKDSLLVNFHWDFSREN